MSNDIKSGGLNNKYKYYNVSAKKKLFIEMKLRLDKSQTQFII